MGFISDELRDMSSRPAMAHEAGSGVLRGVLTGKSFYFLLAVALRHAPFMRLQPFDLFKELWHLRLQAVPTPAGKLTAEGEGGPGSPGRWRGGVRVLFQNFTFIEFHQVVLDLSLLSRIVSALYC